jgi:hypothetical protein
MLRYSARWPRSLTQIIVLHCAAKSATHTITRECRSATLTLHGMRCDLSERSHVFAAPLPAPLTGSTYALIASAEILM